ncbi:hypothetical protein [Variovorax sp. KK3]|uniref:hypothetical protein n=1 Tax=Variovorax sp. KK3 TaxID=1855728 RepID=UPI00097C64E8|nr:hypothetical protein [Variovorax sp. KK3]
MATFGEALEALEEFRADLVQAQMSVAVPQAQAMAFSAMAGEAAAGPLAHVHATGVGIRDDGQFVVKVYMFDAPSVQSASTVPVLSDARQGVAIDVEHLPVQVAFDRRASRKSVAALVANPGQHQMRHRPVPAGVEIGPLGGKFVGTLGCFVRRGGDEGGGPLFILSNNHVLANVNRFPVGTPFTQPFSAASADTIASLSSFEPILFPAPGSQPRNVIDAAIAVVQDPKKIKTGAMLNIPNYTPQLLAPRPGMVVTKAGRTTGVTVGMIRAIRVRGVQVNYGTQQMPIIATFDNAITITGNANLPFSNPGDSGSVILEQKSGRPVALLFAGDGATTTACDVSAACARFNVHPV